MPKTIWFINHYAGGPGISSAYRAYELSRAWQSDGHRALVVMASYNNPAEQTDHHPFEQVIDGVRYVAVRTTRYVGNGVSRIWSMAVFSTRLFRIDASLPADEHRPDAIIVSSVHPFPIFAGAWLAHKHNARLVFEIRDLWPLTLTTLLGKSKYHPFVMLCALTERFAARKADLITSVLPNAQQYFTDNSIRIKSFAWLPNGVSRLGRSDESVVESDASRAVQDVVEACKAQQHCVFVYAGALGPPNAMELFIDALKWGASVAPDTKVSTIILGNGISRAQLEERASELENVHFFDPLPKEDAQRVIELCDVGYAGCKPVPDLYKYGMALNKAASYLDAGLPVILATDPCSDPVSESGAGVTQGFRSPEALWECVSDMARRSGDDRKEMGRKGQQYAGTVLNYTTIAQNYIKAIFGANE